MLFILSQAYIIVIYTFPDQHYCYLYFPRPTLLQLYFLRRTLLQLHFRRRMYLIIIIFSKAYSQNKVERSPWLPDDRTPLPAKVFYPVDHPTQLTCIWIFICFYLSTYKEKRHSRVICYFLPIFFRAQKLALQKETLGKYLRRKIQILKCYHCKIFGKKNSNFEMFLLSGEYSQ